MHVRFPPDCSSSVTLPIAYIKGSVPFPRGFPTGLSHVPPWCESILGFNVEAVQGNRFPGTASTFKPIFVSHHGGTWDSPVGKPRGKATDPLIYAMGSVTLLLQLGRKANVHAPTRDED